MSFLPGEEARELGDTVRRWLTRDCGRDVVRAAVDDPGPAAVWRRPLWYRTAALGLTGLVIPDKYTGSGAGPVELGVVAEELGRALFPGPFLSTVVLAGLSVGVAGTEEAHGALLPAIASGEVTATLASGVDPGTTPLTAELCDGSWVVSGTAQAVVDAVTADRVIAVAATTAGIGLFEVADPVRTQLTAMDHTRPLGAMTFEREPARVLADPSDPHTEDRLQVAHDLASLVLAAEQLGGATRVLEMALSHAGTRHQFGRAIGSFQAVKHRCADMLLEIESARSTVHHGLHEARHALSGDVDVDALALSASLARAVASDAFLRVAAWNVQLHGGIGFTWEHDAHLYLKRARSSQLLLGSPTRARARLLPLVLADADRDTGQDLAPATTVPEVDAFLAETPVGSVPDRELRARRYDAGLAMVHHVPGHGGLGWASSRHPEVEAAFLAAGAEDWSARNVIGLGMAMSTIHAHGTEDQKQFHLRPSFTGERIWCQLFSEPGAGSDLAGLATRATADGEEFVLNGQKVWTSLGHVADYGLLLARTDPTVPKHRGLTYFLLDMSLPGIEVRPLRQLTGEAEFNEVHFTDVRMPAGAVLGEVGEGWKVATTTLMNERVAIGGSRTPRHGGPISQAIESYRAAATRGAAGPIEGDRLMQLWSNAEAARLTTLRTAARGGEPGPEGSVAKLQMAEGNQAVYSYCVELAGREGLFVDGYEQGDGDSSGVFGGGDVRKAWLRSLANSIEGGTSEVLRTVLGERVLGLPREPSLDRDVPWNETKR